MKRILVFILLFLAAAAAIPAQTQDTNARPLLDNLYMSSGRLPINDLVADLEVFKPMDSKKQTGSSMVLASKDKIIFKRPNKLKIDTLIVDPGAAMDGKQFTIYRDGKQMFMYASVGQYPVKKGRDEPSPTLSLPPNLQVYPQDAENPCTLAGSETVNGVPCKIVKIADSSRSTENMIWIDTKRWVPIKMVLKVPDAKGEKTITKSVSYRDFKQLKDGRWFPFSIEVKENNVTNRLVVYRALSVNVGIQDNIFEPMQKFYK